MGSLIPINLTEVLPGDSIQQATSCLIRCSPLLAPVMHPVRASIHHWYVPHRLVWDEFEEFITGGPDGMDDTVFPTITMPVSGGAVTSSLADYFGVPTGVNSLEVSALPFRAYAKIWNEWYRDQDLQNPLTVDLTSGADITTSTALQNVCWEKDYFTSSRPWPQKGPDITIPLGTRADVHSQTYDAGVGGYKVPAGGPTGAGYTPAGAGGDYTWDNQGAGKAGIWADLSAAASASINDLREAFALQKYEEARARYGSRFTEYLRYLGVRSSDARLQRPEYLGGGKQTLQISEVLQTGVTTSGTPSVGVGNLSGHGIGAMRSARYRRYFEEHGYIFSFVSTKPKTIYAQGLPRTWNRRIKEDFFQQELQHIGQQEVLNKELYAAHASPEATFGYQDRYDEYRRTESTIAGEFRTTLNFWHMARIFSSDPTLNDTFISSVPTTRNYAVTSSDPLWIMVQHSIQARRLLSQTGYSRGL